MKILIDIPDNKAASLLDVLTQIPFVKARQITDAKAQMVQELREAVEEMKQVRSGKKQTRSLSDFLNEL